MLNKTLITLMAVAALGASSAAFARGGMSGGGHFGGGHFGHMGHFGHQFPRNHIFINPFLRNQVFRNRLLRNQAFFGGLGGWGWDWGWGGYGNNGYGNNTVVVFPQAVPQAANVTGSTSSGPCRWNQETFNVPSSAGGTRSVQIVSCRSGQLASEAEGAKQ